MKVATRLVIAAVLLIGFAACGDDDDAGTSAAKCADADGTADLISSYSIQVKNGTGTAKFALSKSGSVGIVFTKPSDKSTPMRIRVPLGTFSADVTHTRKLTAAELADVTSGIHEATLRFFEPDKLNVGEPLDTATRCVQVS